MSLTISSAGQPAQPTSQPTSSSRSTQQTALDQLVSQYKTDVARKASSDVLEALSRQISTAAKELGEQVALPKASSDSGDAGTQAKAAPPAGGAPPAQAAKTASGKVDVTA